MPRIADARLYQILFLGMLLTTGVLARDFSVRFEQVALTFAAGIATQLACVRVLKLKNIAVLSAIVTSFGLSILLRADNLWVHPLIAALAIGSKFVVRLNGKHVFNPANLGVVLAVSLLPGAWVSPGQWGNDLLLGGWFVALGSVVTNRARAADISWMFLACYGALLFGRAAWLGQDFAIALHQMHNGALLLFAFFMISDPMTIPNASRARLAYAVMVALAAGFWQFGLFKPNALIWALFLSTSLVPLLDRLFPAPRFAWGAPRATREALNA